jgi:thioesterase DpgC
MNAFDTSMRDQLRQAGLPEGEIKTWHGAAPRGTSDLSGDRGAYSAYWKGTQALLARLPKKPKRNGAEAVAAAALLEAGRRHRDIFLKAHAVAIYDLLTKSRTRFVRLEDLVFEAASAVPGLAPSREAVAAEAGEKQGDKDGVEIDQGLFLSRVLADERAGLHLCHAMLLPRAESGDALAEFEKRGILDLKAARLERRGKAVEFTLLNPRYLNAEDDATLDAEEIVVDVAILDPASEIAIFRGGVVENPKYAGRRIFGAGINLTHLYRGMIPFVWFMRRDMGLVHKFLRGVARPEVLPDDVNGTGIEKPWIAAVETFAIGGHCQALLTMDFVVAAHDAFMTLPARKEGIIPGVANLRLPRFVGDRIARQAIQYERRLTCDSPEGRMICDEIVPAGEMDEALDRVIAGLTSSGAVSAVGNRRAFRVGQEPIDVFRRYMANYAREQAFCHFSPALIANLERHWNAAQRSI